MPLMVLYSKCKYLTRLLKTVILFPLFHLLILSTSLDSILELSNGFVNINRQDGVRRVSVWKLPEVVAEKRVDSNPGLW